MRVLFFALLLLPVSVLAEEMPSVATDSRVRVTAPSFARRPFIGRVNLIESDALTLTPRTRIPLDAITKFELSLGRKPLGQSVKSSAWKGALLVFGVVAATAINSYDDWDNPSGNKILLAMLGGGAAGGVIGGLYGTVHRPERWTAVPPAVLKRYAPPAYRGNAPE